MTDSPWLDLQNSTIRLGNMVSALQIAREQIGVQDETVVGLLGLVRDSLGAEIGTIEDIWNGMRQDGKSSPRVVK